MSRNTAWTILIKKQDNLASAVVALLLRQIRESGFSYISPHTNSSMIIDPCDSKIVQMPDESSATAFVCSRQAAALLLWKETLVVSIEFDVTGAGLTEQAESLGIDDDSLFGALVIRVDYSYVRMGEYSRTFYPAINRLFCAICIATYASYGFCVDEWAVEGLVREWHVQREISYHVLPKISFPVIYYSAEQFPDVTAASLSHSAYCLELVDSCGYLAWLPAEIPQSY